MTAKNVLIDQIEQLTTPALEQHQAELIDLQFVHEHGQWVLRFFVDKQGGVTLGDCAVISEHIGRLLDASDIIAQSYSLEVSSPGIDRPLRKTADFQKFIGERVDIMLYAPLNGRRHFRGTLEAADAERVTVKDYEAKSYALPLADLAKAKLDPEIKI
jgi:ribosome maturation factor RimP